MEDRKPSRAPTAPLDVEAVARKQRATDAQRVYGRGSKLRTRDIKDKKLRANLRRLEGRYKDATLASKDAEILLEHSSGFLEPEHELERTYKIRQDEIKASVASSTADKGFELKLPEFGPYAAEYTRNGRHLLFAGRKGHAFTTDWRDGKLGCELQLGETVRGAKWLHNELHFAVAQKKYVYIYDHNGVEIHKLSKHVEPKFMEFLPYHFLLATTGKAGVLRYTDTSTGQQVAEMPTKLGEPTAFAQNPHNAVILAGHSNGQVTLWSPNSSTPLVKLLTHSGPVRALAVDREGRYMVSTGQDMKMSVWDIRAFKEVNNYFTRQPGQSLAVSDRNLTAVGWGTHVSIWRGLFDKAADDTEEHIKVKSPYMEWGGEGQRIESTRWCPFEDILGVGHDQGFASLLIPGAGEPNYDALELNPYENKKQRQEGEVKMLLNKLQPSMISIDPEFIGNLDVRSDEQRRRNIDLDSKPEDTIEKLKNRGRGKNSALRRYLRKRGQKNVIDEKRVRAEEALKQRSKREVEKFERQKAEYGPALARFAHKGG